MLSNSSLSAASSAAGRCRQSPPPGEWTDTIAGRFRRITVHQLAMAWWLYRDRHITMRQLRVWFAAHEMDERRRYAKQAERPLYGLEEIKALVGGRGTQSADRDLSADVKALGRLGLVKISAHRIEFAVSFDQIAIAPDVDVSGFWDMLALIQNQRRTVPVPRRTCRALAGGMRPAMMAVVVALMIRGLYWHRPRNPRPQNEQGGERSTPQTSGGRAVGGYRVDGSTKRSWIAEVFGVSERAVTDARARLIEIGWLKPDADQPQWHLNRYGARDAINVHAFGPADSTKGGRAVQEPEPSGESASPSADFSAESASPCLNSSASLTGNINTRKPAPTRSGPVPPGAGVSIETKKGGRKKKSEPNLRNITPDDLNDTRRLLELHRQAIEQGHPVGGEAGRLDFLALADRARTCGNNPARLFAWLLKQRRFEFITQANEDAAADRLRVLRDGPRQRGRGEDDWNRSPKPQPMALSDDDKLVIACIRTAKQHRGAEPFMLARQLKGWSRDRWDEAHAAYQQKERERWG